MADGRTGRRERKKFETRRALRAAAVRLVGERGLDAVTIEDITEAADVSPRTFFNYFSSKEEVLTAPDPERLAHLNAELARRPRDEPPLLALQAVLVADSRELVRHRDEWQRQLSVLKSDPRLLAAMATNWGVLERSLAAGITDRLGPDADPLRAHVLAAAAVAALRVAIHRWKTETHAALATIVQASFDALISVGHEPTRATPAAHSRQSASPAPVCPAPETENAR